jgi:hypothetical protein
MDNSFFLPYITSNQSDFLNAVNNVAYSLGVDPIALLADMWQESTLNPQAELIVNGNVVGGGLVGFLVSTISQFGIDFSDYIQLSNVDQMPYVQQLFYPNSQYINCYTDLRLADFYPAALIYGWPDSQIFPDAVYQANKNLDIDGNGYLTVGEFRRSQFKGFPADLANYLQTTQFSNISQEIATAAEVGGGALGAILLIGVAAGMFKKKSGDKVIYKIAA